MRSVAAAVLLVVASASAQSESPARSEAGAQLAQVSIRTTSGHPQIEIGSYTLLSRDAAAQRADAEAVMELKKKFPLAVMTKDRELFDRILSRDFVFRGEGDDGLLTRADYIQNRVNATGSIERVRYENLVLQFFGDVAVLTYRNVLKNKDAAGQPDETEHISWADVYVKESGEWKIGAAYVIDYRAAKE